MNQVSQQDRARNDQYVILTCQKQASAQIVMVVVDTTTGQAGAEMNIASGPYVLTSCTEGNPTTCTTAGAMSDGITPGTQVTVSAAGGGTWASLNGTQPIKSASGTTLVLDVDSSGFGAYTPSSGSAGIWMPNAGGCDLRFGPNYAWVGYLGDYVMVDWGAGNTGNNRLCGIETFNLQNAASAKGSWDYVGQVIPDSTHGDLAMVNGAEHFVAFAAGTSWGNLAGTVARCAVPDGWSQPGHAGCVSMLTNPTGGGHITAHAFNAPTPFVLFDDDAVNVDDPWYPRQGEIVKLYWDSTPSAPHLERLAHSRTDTHWFIACDTCQASSYWSQAKTTLNMDGTKAWFASSWGPGDGVNTYVISGIGPPGNGGSLDGGSTDAGRGAGADADTDAGDAGEGEPSVNTSPGCSCDLRPRSTPPWSVWSMLGALALLRRRRANRPDRPRRVRDYV
jgi:hypothetical protein